MTAHYRTVEVEGHDNLPPGGRAVGCARTAAVARVSDQLAHVPGPDPATGEQVPRDRAGPSRLRLLGDTGCRFLRVQLLRACVVDHRLQVQLDLVRTYLTNFALYPKFQEYFRTSQVPLLATWGENDEIFPQPARRPSSVISPAPRSSSCRPGISPSRPTPPRSPYWWMTFLKGPWRADRRSGDVDPAAWAPTFQVRPPNRGGREMKRWQQCPSAACLQ